MTKGISVIVCCYNSASRLPETIRHLAAQVVPIDIPWEIIVIDNASIDRTKEVAINEWKKYQIPNVQFKVVQETILGLSNARERGIKESIYDYLLFCDDDNWLNPNYLNTGYEILSNKPFVGVIGGRGIEAPEIPPPNWFEKHRLSYAVGPHSEISGDITDTRGDVYGAGAFFRKEALNKLYHNGFKSLLRDRTGAKLSSGGDSELCICIKLLGYRIWYEERLTFYHFIPRGRLCKKYFLNLHKGISQGLTQLLPYYFITDSTIQYEKRCWIRKHWVWFFASRISHIMLEGLAWNLIFRKNNVNREKDLRALFFYESMKTIWNEKTRTTKNYTMIINSKWFNSPQTF